MMKYDGYQLFLTLTLLYVFDISAYFYIVFWHVVVVSPKSINDQTGLNATCLVVPTLGTSLTRWAQSQRAI